jgi:lipopolysaccharide heptosyltransferase II
MGFHPIEGLLHRALRIVHVLDRRHPRPTDLGTKAIRRILVVSSTAIGDTLLSTPALRSLRLAYPEARISLLINPAYIGMFRDHPRVDELIPYRRGWLGFAWQVPVLRRRHFDLVCILHGNEPQATPLAYLSGARFIFKLPNTSRFRFLLTNSGTVLDWDAFEHGIDQRLAVAKLAMGTTTDRRMELPVADAARTAVTELLAQQNVGADTPLIALQAGASTASRRWAPGHFVALAKRLLAERPTARIVLTGSPGERSLTKVIATGIDNARVWNAAGKVPLPLLPALVERCALMVSGDTGPMHLAVTVGTPVVALFAVSDWRRSGPAYDLDRHVVIQKWRTCDPCKSKNCPYAEPLCMENITVDEVFEAVTTILDRKGTQ